MIIIKTASYIFLISLSVTILAAPILGSYTDGHDSLLYDGANGYTNYFQETANDCLMKVLRVNGNVTGKVLKKETVKICGGTDTVTTYEKRQLKEGDMVLTGQTLTTERDKDFVIAQLNDGENLFLGGERGAVVVKDYCKEPPNIYMQLEAGKLGIDWSPLFPKTITICTEMACLRIKGTVISIEIVKDGDAVTTVLKVYEGSAIFGNNIQNKDYKDDMNKKGTDVIKAYEDFQNGKISMEEFIKKSQETKDLMTGTEPLIINAGFECRIKGTDKPSEPVPFDMNEERWWEAK